jgi:hypothetical protein
MNIRTILLHKANPQTISTSPIDFHPLFLCGKSRSGFRQRVIPTNMNVKIIFRIDGMEKSVRDGHHICDGFGRD